MTTLYLMSTHLTDAGMKALAELRNVTELYLGGAKITDAGLKDSRNSRT